MLARPRTNHGVTTAGSVRGHGRHHTPDNEEREAAAIVHGHVPGIGKPCATLSCLSCPLMLVPPDLTRCVKTVQ